LAGCEPDRLLIVNYGPSNNGYRQLCSRCFNTEIEKAGRGSSISASNPWGSAIAGENSTSSTFVPHFHGPCVSLDAFELHNGEPAGYRKTTC
jgi:hypothetical protein